MDMGIVNAAHVIEDKYENIDKELLKYVEDVHLNRCDIATERMLEFAATLDPKSKSCALRRQGEAAGPAAAKSACASNWCDLEPEKRVGHALIKGIDEHIVKDIEEARVWGKYKKALHIIEGPLMDGMNVMQGVKSLTSYRSLFPIKSSSRLFDARVSAESWDVASLFTPQHETGSRRAVHRV